MTMEPTENDLDCDILGGRKLQTFWDKVAPIDIVFA
jgi:hypothetical protein